MNHEFCDEKSQVPETTLQTLHKTALFSAALVVKIKETQFLGFKINLSHCKLDVFITRFCNLQKVYSFRTTLT